MASAVLRRALVPHFQQRLSNTKASVTSSLRPRLPLGFVCGRREVTGTNAQIPSLEERALTAGVAANLHPSRLNDDKAVASQLPQLSDEDKELLASLDAAVEALGLEATSDHPLVEARDKVAVAYRDKAALLKRDWTDEMYQDGEAFNEHRVAEIEAMLASGLSAVGGGLEDGRNLGAALDLVGAYMKNYMLDKADSVLARCGPYVSARGGVWMVKWLNHVSTVRMKRGRSLEALEMLYELELYSPYSPEEAPEFFETLYRNLGWALKALGRLDDAVYYFERMSQAAETHKGKLDWFDCWDIGKLVATRSYRDSNMPGFYRARAMIEDSLAMHIEAEPEDLVMRAKVHDSLAECFFIVEEFDKAEEHYSAAYNLMRQTVGDRSPLFGKQARHSANLRIAESRHAEALPFLAEALAVEAAKDSVKVMEAMELVDLIVNTQQKCGTEVLDDQVSNHHSIKALTKNYKSHGLNDSRQYGVLCHKMSLLYLHEHKKDSSALRRALRLAKTSVKLLRKHQDNQASDWLMMAEMHLRMLASAKQQHGSDLKS